MYLRPTEQRRIQNVIAPQCHSGAVACGFAISHAVQTPRTGAGGRGVEELENDDCPMPTLGVTGYNAPGSVSSSW